MSSTHHSRDYSGRFDYGSASHLSHEERKIIEEIRARRAASAAPSAPPASAFGASPRSTAGSHPGPSGGSHPGPSGGSHTGPFGGSHTGPSGSPAGSYSGSPGGAAGADWRPSTPLRGRGAADARYSPRSGGGRERDPSGESRSSGYAGRDGGPYSRGYAEKERGGRRRGDIFSDDEFYSTSEYDTPSSGRSHFRRREDTGTRSYSSRSNADSKNDAKKKHSSPGFFSKMFESFKSKWSWKTESKAGNPRKTRMPDVGESAKRGLDFDKSDDRKPSDGNESTSGYETAREFFTKTKDAFKNAKDFVWDEKHQRWKKLSESMGEFVDSESGKEAKQICWQSIVAYFMLMAFIVMVICFLSFFHQYIPRKMAHCSIVFVWMCFLRHVQCRFTWFVLLGVCVLVPVGMHDLDYYMQIGPDEIDNGRVFRALDACMRSDLFHEPHTLMSGIFILRQIEQYCFDTAYTERCEYLKKESKYILSIFETCQQKIVNDRGLVSMGVIQVPIYQNGEIHDLVTHDLYDYQYKMRTYNSEIYSLFLAQRLDEGYFWEEDNRLLKALQQTTSYVGTSVDVAMDVLIKYVGLGMPTFILKTLMGVNAFWSGWNRFSHQALDLKYLHNVLVQLQNTTLTHGAVRIRRKMMSYEHVTFPSPVYESPPSAVIPMKIWNIKPRQVTLTHRGRNFSSFTMSSDIPLGYSPRLDSYEVCRVNTDEYFKLDYDYTRCPIAAELAVAALEQQFSEDNPMYCPSYCSKTVFSKSDIDIENRYQVAFENCEKKNDELKKQHKVTYDHMQRQFSDELHRKDLMISNLEKQKSMRVAQTAGYSRFERVAAEPPIAKIVTSDGFSMDDVIKKYVDEHHNKRSNHHRKGKTFEHLEHVENRYSQRENHTSFNATFIGCMVVVVLGVAIVAEFIRNLALLGSDDSASSGGDSKRRAAGGVKRK